MRIPGIFKQLTAPRTLATVIALALAPVTGVQAQEREWWFEVELIVFKRDQDPATIAEQFDSQITDFRGRADFNLITPLLSPDLTMLVEALPSCESATQAEHDAWPEFAANLTLMDRNASLDDLWHDKSWQANQQGMSDIDLYLLGLVNQFHDKPTQMPDTRADDTMESLNRAFAVESVDNRTADAAPVPFYEGFIPTPVIVPDTLYCRFDSDVLAMTNPFAEVQDVAISINEVPGVIGGVEYPYSDSPYLLSTESLQLNKLARDINRQRGLSLLLHMGWRQEILFGQTKAKSMRLFAGRNFAAEFDANGKRLPNQATSGDAVEQITMSPDIAKKGQQQDTYPEQHMQTDDLFARIRDALAQESEPELTLPETTAAEEQFARTEELWELDGVFKVFLRYIKGTPYLHIDSELEYRAPTFSEGMLDTMQVAQRQVDENASQAGDSAQQAIAPDRLASFNFNQLRRVISTQYHYFDHPMFGLVVQIRRYERPSPPETEETNGQ